MFKKLSFGLAFGDGRVGFLESISKTSVGVCPGASFECFLCMELAGLVHAVCKLLPLVY